MSLKKFFNNNQAFCCSYFSGLLKLLPIAIIFLAALVYIMPVTTYQRLTSQFLDFDFHNPETITYILAPKGSQIYIFAFLLFASILCAVFSFKFLFKKNSTDTYMSLGISRFKLFFSKFLAGFTMLILPITIVMIISTMMSIRMFGNQGDLLLSSIYCFFGYTITAFISYSLSVLVCVLVGTLVEALTYSFIVINIISILSITINFIFNIFLVGSSFSFMKVEYLQKFITESLLAITKYFNPLLFFYDEALIHCSGFKSYSDNYNSMKNYLLSGYNSNFYDAYEFRIWLLITWVIVGSFGTLTALKLFKYRRNEIASSLGKSKVMRFTAGITVMFFTFTVTLNIISDLLPSNIKIVLAWIITMIICLVINFIMKMSFHKYLESLKYIFVQGLILLGVFILSNNGLLGYSNYIPDTSDVSNAYISYYGSPDLFDGSGTSFNQTVDFSKTYSDLSFETPKDIELIKSLHRALINQGMNDLTKSNLVKNPNNTFVHDKVDIVYWLKDGGYVTRCYDKISLSFLRKILELDKTDSIKGEIESYFNSILPHMKGNDYVSSNLTVNTIHLQNPLLSSTYDWHPTPVMFKGLIAALKHDLLNQNITDRYMSKDPALGVLSLDFRSPDDSHVYTMDLTYIKSFYITNEFKETISILKKYHLYKYFTIKDQVKELIATEYKYCNVSSEQYMDRKSRYFRAINLQENGYTGLYPDRNSNMDISKNFINDSKEIDKIIPYLQTSGLIDEGGYYIQMHFAGKKNTSLLFLPYSKATDIIKKLAIK